MDVIIAFVAGGFCRVLVTIIYALCMSQEGEDRE